MSPVQDFGIALIKRLQTLCPALDVPMSLLAMLVKPEFFLLFALPVFYWLLSPRNVFRLFVALLVDMALGPASSVPTAA